jgi:hypothetical protein
VLPDADNRPSFSAQFSEISLISLPVAAYLLLPKNRDFVLPQRKPVTMPEVTVDEDGDPLPCKHDVGISWYPPDMFPKTQTLGMKLRPYCFFRCGIPTFDARHAVAALLGCQIIRHCPILDKD